MWIGSEFDTTHSILLYVTHPVSFASVLGQHAPAFVTKIVGTDEIVGRDVDQRKDELSWMQPIISHSIIWLFVAGQ